MIPHCAQGLTREKAVLIPVIRLGTNETAICGENQGL